jgi:hypothetical protein
MRIELSFTEDQNIKRAKPSLYMESCRKSSYADRIAPASRLQDSISTRQERSSSSYLSNDMCKVHYEKTEAQYSTPSTHRRCWVLAHKQSYARWPSLHRDSSREARGQRKGSAYAYFEHINQRCVTFGPWHRADRIRYASRAHAAPYRVATIRDLCRAHSENQPTSITARADSSSP